MLVVLNFFSFSQWLWDGWWVYKHFLGMSYDHQPVGHGTVIPYVPPLLSKSLADPQSAMTTRSSPLLLTMWIIPFCSSYQHGSIIDHRPSTLDLYWCPSPPILWAQHFVDYIYGSHVCRLLYIGVFPSTEWIMNNILQEHIINRPYCYSAY